MTIVSEIYEMAVKKTQPKPANAVKLRPSERTVLDSIRRKLNLPELTDAQMVRIVLSRFEQSLPERSVG